VLDDPLLQFLASGPKLKFIPFGGNGGDRLLQFAERRLIEESAAREVTEEYEYLCYHGGGYFGWYPDFDLLQGVEPGPEPLVFFPRACLWRDDETFETYRSEFERIGRPVIFYAREPESADQFVRMAEKIGAEVLLSHSCVLLYECEVFGKDEGLLRTVLRDPHPNLVGVYLRADDESLGWGQGICVSGCDVLTVDPAMCGFLSPEHTGTEIGGAAYMAYLGLVHLPSLVITDRLHVALGRRLFGLDTILLPSLGHKVTAVWRRSLSEDPRGIVFVETPEELRRAVEDHGLSLE